MALHGEERLSPSHKPATCDLSRCEGDADVMPLCRYDAVVDDEEEDEPGVRLEALQRKEAARTAATRAVLRESAQVPSPCHQLPSNRLCSFRLHSLHSLLPSVQRKGTQVLLDTAVPASQHACSAKPQPPCMTAGRLCLRVARAVLVRQELASVPPGARTAASLGHGILSIQRALTCVSSVETCPFKYRN